MELDSLKQDVGSTKESGGQDNKNKSGKQGETKKIGKQFSNFYQLTLLTPMHAKYDFLYGQYQFLLWWILLVMNYTFFTDTLSKICTAFFYEIWQHLTKRLCLNSSLIKPNILIGTATAFGSRRNISLAIYIFIRD